MSDKIHSPRAPRRVPCRWCAGLYTPQGITLHQATCHAREPAAEDERPRRRRDAPPDDEPRRWRRPFS